MYALVEVGIDETEIADQRLTRVSVIAVGSEEEMYRHLSTIEPMEGYAEDEDEDFLTFRKRGCAIWYEIQPVGQQGE